MEVKKRRRPCLEARSGIGPYQKPILHFVEDKQSKLAMMWRIRGGVRE